MKIFEIMHRKQVTGKKTEKKGMRFPPVDRDAVIGGVGTLSMFISTVLQTTSTKILFGNNFTFFSFSLFARITPYHSSISASP